MKCRARVWSHFIDLILGLFNVFHCLLVLWYLVAYYRLHYGRQTIERQLKSIQSYNITVLRSPNCNGLIKEALTSDFFSYLACLHNSEHELSVLLFKLTSKQLFLTVYLNTKTHGSKKHWLQISIVLLNQFWYLNWPANGFFDCQFKYQNSLIKEALTSDFYCFIEMKWNEMNYQLLMTRITVDQCVACYRQ